MQVQRRSQTAKELWMSVFLSAHNEWKPLEDLCEALRNLPYEGFAHDRFVHELIEAARGIRNMRVKLVDCYLDPRTTVEKDEAVCRLTNYLCEKVDGYAEFLVLAHGPWIMAHFSEMLSSNNEVKKANSSFGIWALVQKVDGFGAALVASYGQEVSEGLVKLLRDKGKINISAARVVFCLIEKVDGYASFLVQSKGEELAACLVSMLEGNEDYDIKTSAACAIFLLAEKVERFGASFLAGHGKGVDPGFAEMISNARSQSKAKAGLIWSVVAKVQGFGRTNTRAKISSGLIDLLGCESENVIIKRNAVGAIKLLVEAVPDYASSLIANHSEALSLLTALQCHTDTDLAEACKEATLAIQYKLRQKKAEEFVQMDIVDDISVALHAMEQYNNDFCAAGRFLMQKRVAEKIAEAFASKKQRKSTI